MAFSITFMSDLFLQQQSQFKHTKVEKNANKQEIIGMAK